MKRLIKIFLFAFISFLCVSGVKANSISSINMDIYLDANGTAHITEVWYTTLNQGTEGYRSYGNLGNAKISNFRVVDGTKEYTTLNYWNTSASFSDKAYKAGINDLGNIVELCWGISNYGSHTYKLMYDIEGFVAENEDSQIIYWELIPSELTELTDNVYIKIYSDEAFRDDLDVWGYGNYGGYAYVYDGVIEVSNDSLSSGEYITVLVKFDKGTFNTNNIIVENFEHYYDMAEDGAEHYVEGSSGIFSIIAAIFAFLWNFGIFIFIFIIVGKSAATAGLKSGTFILDYGTTGKKLPKEVNMFRDIPCNKDIYRAYWVAHNYGLMKKQTDFLGAILLKWLKEKQIRIESKTAGALFKKEETTIVFESQMPTLETQLENDLYNYMYQASKDGILESREFEKWCRNNYSKILNWFDKVLDYENKKLLEEGKLVETEKTTMKIFKSKIYQVDPSMMQEAIEMKGLKEFFKEFENMQDKEAIQVHLWEEYLIYAQIFGVADKVAKQFKKLYPEVITDYDYDSIIFVNSISHSGMVSASSAKSRAESYSSGGGGFSSGGGGGGSFGGGGGGGFR